MTKKQLKEEYMEWNIEIKKLGERKKEIFEELQELNYEEGDGHKWCGIEPLVGGLAKNGHIDKAMELVSEYYKICGKEAAATDLAIATKNFGI